VHAYIYRAGTHTHTMSPAASSACAIARTCTWTRCGHVRAHRLNITQHHTSTHLSIDIGRLSLYIDTNLCTPTRRDPHARARARGDTLVATHMRAYARHVPRVIGTKTTIYKSTRVATYRDWAVTRTELPELRVCSALLSPQHEPAAICAHTANMRIRMQLLLMRADIHGTAAIRQ
jgi:hypothetical protein